MNVAGQMNLAWSKTGSYHPSFGRNCRFTKLLLWWILSFTNTTKPQKLRWYKPVWDRARIKRLENKLDGVGPCRDQTSSQCCFRERRMSVFTPGHFTDLTGEAETEAGWPTSDEREEPGRDVREQKVGRERDSWYFCNNFFGSTFWVFSLEYFFETLSIRICMMKVYHKGFFQSIVQKFLPAA